MAQKNGVRISLAVLDIGVEELRQAFVVQSGGRVQARQLDAARRRSCRRRNAITATSTTKGPNASSSVSTFS